MTEMQDDETGKDLCGGRRIKPPSKKKFEEDLEVLCSTIRSKEQELEALKNASSTGIQDEIKNQRIEKNASIERRKKIDIDLQKHNKDLSEMMRNLSRLESTLHYKSEDKINEAIRRLEWNMKVQNFKLSEEKKIVAEIDSLRRSKKSLIQYLGVKKEVDAMRDKQRLMREERDFHFHRVTKLKQLEEKLRSDGVGLRSKAQQLRKEVDALYESKRQLIALYKKQREEFQDIRERKRQETCKKREEEKRAQFAALAREMEEIESQRQPFEEQICLCNTLIHYLMRFISNTDLDLSLPGISPVSSTASDESSLGSQASVGPAEELEDGQYVLLRKTDDNYITSSSKHVTRKRRSRKQSMVKRINHTPEVLTQFLQFNLTAPTTISEIFASLEELQTRKQYYEREADVVSEAELSVTESALLEMSRQASHTESSDGLTESRPNDHILEKLLQMSEKTNRLEHAHYYPASNYGLECAQSDCFLNLQRQKEENIFDQRSFPPLSGSSFGKKHLIRLRSEGSNSTLHSSSTVDGACDGVDEHTTESEDLENGLYEYAGDLDGAGIWTRKEKDIVTSERVDAVWNSVSEGTAQNLQLDLNPQRTLSANNSYNLTPQSAVNDRKFSRNVSVESIQTANNSFSLTPQTLMNDKRFSQNVSVESIQDADAVQKQLTSNVGVLDSKEAKKTSYLCDSINGYAF